MKIVTKSRQIKLTILAVAALLIVGSATAQQLYKWIGADGKVTYSDTPPPRSAKRAETKNISSGGTTAENLPYEVAQAVKSSPVVLYTTTACGACDRARSFLTTRGVPFSEKTVTTPEDSDRLKRAGGDSTLPLLLVGRTRQIGFESSTWGATLSAAGYPETSKLAPDYRNAPAVAAAPVVEKQIKASAKIDSDPSPEIAPKAINDKAPPGFHF